MRNRNRQCRAVAERRTVEYDCSGLDLDQVAVRIRNTSLSSSVMSVKRTNLEQSFSKQTERTSLFQRHGCGDAASSGTETEPKPLLDTNDCFNGRGRHIRSCGDHKHEVF